MITDVAVPIELALVEVRAATASFLERFGPTDRLVVFCHFDADGLAAGAIFGRAMSRLGFADVTVVPSGRGESAFSDAARRRLGALKPAGLIVTDLGVHRDGVLSEVPTLYVDHHQPEGEPDGAMVISGYRWEPIPASAWLAFELMAPLADIEDLGWIAAVGIMSDLGDGAPWPKLPEIKKRYTAKWLKEAVALVNAARRSSAFDIGTPLDLLMRVDSPKKLATDARGADKLRAYRAEVKTALAEARKAAPGFARGQPFALLKLDSPVQLHRSSPNSGADACPSMPSSRPIGDTCRASSPSACAPAGMTSTCPLCCKPSTSARRTTASGTAMTRLQAATCRSRRSTVF
jgi:single-stranded-DNA-specific exonuclease